MKTKQSNIAAEKRRKLTLKDMTFVAVMAALICIAAPVSVPLGAVPLSLAGFVVCLAGGLLGSRRGTLAVLIYIMLGAVGLPVFSGGNGGFGQLFGITGGYIAGYIPCALISGIFSDKFCKVPPKGKNPFRSGVWAIPVGMAAGTLVLYVVGTAWFAAVQGISPWAAAAVCVLPFIPGDIIKIACASGITISLRHRLIDK